uniref:Uncharacterized protein n=1 Tax=Lepeophtheirus salmonis TaxID=72036 RepID=A0A0K2U110_LEPSM
MILNKVGATFCQEFKECFSLPISFFFWNGIGFDILSHDAPFLHFNKNNSEIR